MNSIKAGRRHILAVSIVLIVTCSGCDAAKSPNNPDTALREVSDPRIESVLQDMLSEEHFTGAVLVSYGTDVVHAKGYGPATSETRNNVATSFHIASMTKQFTAAAIMQLVEAGNIDLDESINRYLPDDYKAADWDAVTVHHLLTHSSGIADYAVTRDYYNVVDGFCLGETVHGMVREAMDKDLEFSPGSEFSYSNIGFTLLGLIIENRSNVSYESFLDENIFKPMGMYSTRVHVEGHVPEENEARGLLWSEEQSAHVRDDIVSLPVTAPDGGLVTTLADFLKWAQIYAGKDQKVLSQSSIELITSRHTASDGKDGPMDSYGYGLAVGNRFIGHAGYIVGFRSQFIFDRETELLIVIFTNNTSNNPQRIASDLLTVLLTPKF